MGVDPRSTNIVKIELDAPAQNILDPTVDLDVYSANGVVEIQIPDSYYHGFILVSSSSPGCVHHIHQSFDGGITFEHISCSSGFVAQEHRDYNIGVNHGGKVLLHGFVLANSDKSCESLMLKVTSPREEKVQEPEPATGEKRYFEPIESEPEPESKPKVKVPESPEESLPTSSDYADVAAYESLDEYIDNAFALYDMPVSRGMYELGNEMLTELNIPLVDAEDILTIAFMAHESGSGDVLEIATMLAYRHNGDMEGIWKVAYEILPKNIQLKTWESEPAPESIPVPVPVPEEVTTEDLRIDEPIVEESEAKDIQVETVEADIILGEFNDDIIFDFPNVIIMEVGKEHRSFFDLKYNEDVVHKCRGTFSIDNIDVAKIVSMGKDEQYNMELGTNFDGSYGGFIHLFGRNVGDTVLHVEVTTEYAAGTAMFSKDIQVIVKEKGTIEENSFFETAGHMIMGGWNALMDFVHWSPN